MSFRATGLGAFAFAKKARKDEISLDAATQQMSIQRFIMFSLIALYFSYRRDVVTAERYIAGLTPAATPASADVVTFPVSQEQKLARAA